MAKHGESAAAIGLCFTVVTIEYLIPLFLLQILYTDVRYTHACRISKSLEEDSYIYKEKSWNLQRGTEKTQGIFHVRCLTALLIHEPDTSHIQK